LLSRRGAFHPRTIAFEVDQPLPDSDLVVSTPERVSFQYQVAGLGTRAIAQILDLLILLGVLFGVYFVAVAVGQVGQDVFAYLIAVIGTFVVIFGYFWACEARSEEHTSELQSPYDLV